MSKTSKIKEQVPSIPNARPSVNLSILLTSVRSAVNEDFVENVVVIPPDGGWGWVIVTAGFICNFITDGVVYTFGIFLDEIGETFNVHPTKVALSTSLTSGFYFTAGPVTCALINRYGFRIVGIIGGIISFVGFISSTFILHLNAFIVLIGVICGIGFNMTYMSSILIVGFYFEKWRALATAITVCGSSIGIIVFPFVGTLLKNYSWIWKFRILSGLTLVSSACALIYLPIKPVKVNAKKNSSYRENASSAFSLNTARTAKSYRLSSIFHNSVFPKVSEYYNPSPSNMNILEQQPLTDNGSVSNSSVGRSMLMYKTDIQSQSLSTVYELEIEENIRKNYDMRCCKQIFCCGKFRRTLNSERPASSCNIVRPMYREDITYTGSLYRLPEYSKATTEAASGTMKSAVSYHLSVTRVATRQDAEENNQCKMCPEAVVRTIATMLHFGLLKSITFVLLTLSGFFTILGLYTPFVFLIQRGTDLNIDEASSTLLLTGIGIANTVGRILCGIISWFPKLDVVVVSYSTLLITGCSIIMSNYLRNLEGQIVFAIVFGINVASVTALRSIMVVELMGLENLTNAYGITVLFFGLGSFIGVPIATLLQNYTGNYEASFIFSGCSVIVSGILIIPIRQISRWEANKKRRISFQP